MSTRYKFGPQLVGNFTRPAVAGELQDVEVEASITDVTAGDPGEVNVEVTFVVPAYDTSEFNLLSEVHAVVFPKGHGLPTDASIAVASPQPKASADASGHTAGGDLVVTIPNVPSGGAGTILTVLGFVDSTTPSDPTAVAPVVADPSAASTVPPASPATPTS